MNYNDEIWKDARGFEGIYQVSNLGRIRSVDRYVNSGLKNVKTFLHKGKILKQQQNRCGYLLIRGKKDNKKINILLHQIVAETFISNPENKPEVNHIDGNKQNNCVSNLEWVTYSENLKHAFRTGLKKSKYGKDHHNIRLVNQYDKDNNFIKQWYGFHEIDRELGFDYRNIHACCNNKQPTAYGYVWRYADDKF